MPPARPLAALCAALLAACASGPTRLYEGPERPADQVALIVRAEGSKARVFAIDSARAHGDAWVVAAGPHRVWINFQVVRTTGDTTWTIHAYCKMEFEAAAGGRYRLESFANQQQQKGADVKTQMGARIVDATGALVASPTGCTGKTPQFD